MGPPRQTEETHSSQTVPQDNALPFGRCVGADGSVMAPPDQQYDHEHGTAATKLIERMLVGELRGNNLALECLRMERRLPGLGWSQLAAEFVEVPE